MSITIKGVDLLNRKLAEVVTNLSNASSVEIGWNKDAKYLAGHRNGGDFVAHVAAINEWGGQVTMPAHDQPIYRSVNNDGEFKRSARFVKKGKSNYQTSSFVEEYTITIPARPFFRTMIAKDRNKYGGMLYKSLQANDFDSKVALADVGTDIQTELTRTIASWSEPSNAKSTIARKGFDDPLHESGLMGSTVNYWVK